MPRCYMVKKRPHHHSPAPCSPAEGSVAPPDYDENPPYTEPHKTEYAELASLPLSERSAAETEAAHELLSLAQSLPPLPSMQPAPLVPVYTYTLQPTNIYFVTNKPQPIYQAVQTITHYPCPCNYPNEQHFGHITYRPVKPESMFPPPAPRSESDSDTEPQLEIASDAEPDTESEQEFQPNLKPELHSDTKAEPEPYQQQEDHEFKYLRYMEPDQIPQEYSEKQVRPLDHTDSFSSPDHYAAPEPRLSNYAGDELPSVQYSKLDARPHFYVESKPTILTSSELETRELSYSGTETASSFGPDQDCEDKKDEPEAPSVITKNQHNRWPKKKFDCNVCGKRYATSSNLSRHKQTHRSLDSLLAKRCAECGKVYVSMPALAMHVLTHKMAHACGICGKQFSRPWLLRGHVRSHTGEKPYNCDSCGKAFADRSNLRAHLQTHSSSKRYKCRKCNKTFALKSYLNKHQETVCQRPEDD